LKNDVNILEEEHYNATSEDFNPEVAEEDASQAIEDEAEEHPDVYEEEEYHD